MHDDNIALSLLGPVLLHVLSFYDVITRVVGKILIIVCSKFLSRISHHTHSTHRSDYVSLGCTR